MGYRYNYHLDLEAERHYRRSAPKRHQWLSALLQFFLMAADFYATVGWLIGQFLQWLALPQLLEIAALGGIHIAFAIYMLWLEKED